MLLSVWATDQAAEITYGFTLELRLVLLVPVNYCFYKKEFLNCSFAPKLPTMENRQP